MKSVLRLAHCGTGAENIGQSVEVVNLCAPDILDCLSGGVDRAAELAGNDDFLDIQVLLGVNAALQGFFAELPCVRRRRPNYGWLIGFQHKQQAFARERTTPDAERAEILRADNVGSTYIEREVERVNIAVVRTHTDLPEPAAFGILKLVKILLGEWAHGGNSR